MRFCAYCRRINERWPDRCRFCGHTWSVKFCRRGHVNPSNAIFCGECGSADLSETAFGGRFINMMFKLFTYPGLLGIVIKVCMFSFFIFLVVRDIEAIIPTIIAFSILALMIKYSLSLLPTWIKSIPKRVYNHLKQNNRTEQRDRRGR